MKHYGTAVLLALALTGCGKKEETKQEMQPVTVKTMTVGATAATGDYHYSGTVEEETVRALSFSMGGTIEQLTVKVGDRVRRGQLIAVVDGTTARHSLDMAEATLAQAQDAHQRMKMLHDRGSLSDIKWVEAESQLAQATSAVKIARKSVTDCRLYAPADGVVSEKYMEVGQNAAPGSPIVKIVSVGRLDVRVSVPEGDMASIRQGQGASIIVPALGDRLYSGRVVEKGVVADPLSRTYNIKVRVEGANKDLLPGMVTRVRLSEERRVKSEEFNSCEERRVKSEEFNSCEERRVKSEELITIPSRLLQLDDNNTYFVWLAVDGKAVRRTVTVGEFTAGGVQIVNGLQAGDKVITEGQQKVSEKCEVRSVK